LIFTMSKKFFVSAITIFLNEERFIKEAIESVLAQTYDHWELLLVDDGSTDRSTEIAMWYAERYPSNVRYLEHRGHENRGMSASRNLGVRYSKGTHIAYLDGDDVWLPNKLERQVEILKAHPEAVMLCARLQVWHSWTGKPEDLHRDTLYGVGPDGEHPYGDILVRPPALLSLFLRDERFIPCSVLVQRDVIESVGGYEDIFRDGYSDSVVFVKMCLTSNVFVSSECWYKYRKHPESYTYRSWHTGEDPGIRQFYLNWIEQYWVDQGVKDREVWQALKEAMWMSRHPQQHGALKLLQHPKRYLKRFLYHIARRLIPESVYCWLRSQLKNQ